MRISGCFRFIPYDLRDGMTIFQIPLPLRYFENDVMSVISKDIGHFVNLVFAEKQYDDRFTIVQCPELLEGRRKVYAFEVPGILRSYSLAILVSNVRGFNHENLRRIGHLILIDVSDVDRDITQIVGERLELLFSSNEAFLGHLKVLGLFVEQSSRFAEGESIKLYNRVSFGQSPVSAAIDLLLNPMIIADPERFDWQVLKLTTSKVIRAK
jgi:hypothetical protein